MSSPTLNFQTQSQLVRVGQVVRHPLRAESPLWCLQVPSVTNKPPSTYVSSIPMGNISSSNLWPNAAARLAFYLKLVLKSSSNNLAPGVLPFTPCKEMEQIVLLRRDGSELQHSTAHMERNGRREGGGKEAKWAEKIRRNTMCLTCNTNCFY